LPEHENHHRQPYQNQQGCTDELCHVHVRVQPRWRQGTAMQRPVSSR
jgi:hypothetical protein